MKKHRLRYAPSPTGYLHIGGARTALINYLWAKHYNGTFIVRIEDTDIARNIADGEKSQLENLRWMGIDIDETTDTENAQYGPYRQSERSSIYHQHINLLVETKKAYRCFCSKAQLQTAKDAQIKSGQYAPKYDQTCRRLDQNIIEQNIAQNKPFVIRVKSPDEVIFEWDDIVRGSVSFHSSDIGDFVILKTNKIPTYNFGVVIDDHLMEITIAIRGEEHISNTPKQLLLYTLFGWEVPRFAHLTIITNFDGKKLSKRDTSLHQFIADYRSDGYPAAAIFNFLALLGWNPSDNTEINTKAELIKKFDEKRLSKSPSIFDIKKMQWISNQYIKKLPFDEYKKLVLPFLEKNINLVEHEEDWINLLISIYQKQISFGREIIGLSELFFTEQSFISDSVIDEIFNSTSQNLIKTFATKLSNLTVWNVETIKSSIKELQKETSIKGKNLFMPLRIATSFLNHGPDLGTTIYLLGKDKVVSHINKVVDHYEN